MKNTLDGRSFHIRFPMPFPWHDQVLMTRGWNVLLNGSGALEQICRCGPASDASSGSRTVALSTRTGEPDHVEDGRRNSRELDGDADGLRSSKPWLMLQCRG
jgi:hypothetical protein